MKNEKHKPGKAVSYLNIMAMLLSYSTAFLFGGAAFIAPSQAQAAVATPIFSDGFEASTFANWTVSTPRWHNDASPSGRFDSKSARADGNTGGEDDYIKKTVSTAGFQNIQIEFWYKVTDNGISATDWVKVQWHTNTGAIWQTVDATIITNETAGDWKHLTAGLPSEAGNKTGFEFRFLSHLLDNKTEIRFDDVVLSGLITDITPPVLNLPGNITEEATGPTGAVITYVATANDAVDGAITPVCTPSSGTAFPLGETTVGCSATDSAGNTSTTGSFKVTVQDTTKPTITLIGPWTQTVTRNSGPYSDPGATCSDLVDGNSTIYGSGAVDTTTNGSYTLAYNCTDSHGNVADQVVRLVVVQDGPKPVITLNGSFSVTVERTTAYTELGAICASQASSSLTVIIGGDTVNTDVVGTYMVTYNCTDELGTAADQLVRTVTVQDTVPPVITIDPYNTAPTSQDVCVTANTNEGSLNASSTCFTANGSFTFTATDSGGNQSSVTVTITNIDKTPPALSGLPGDIASSTTSTSGMAIAYTPPTASDNRDEVVDVVCAPPSESTFPIGTTQVTCNATDSAGNAASGSFNVAISLISGNSTTVIPGCTDPTATNHNPGANLNDDSCTYGQSTPSGGSDVPTWLLPSLNIGKPTPPPAPTQSVLGEKIVATTSELCSEYLTSYLRINRKNDADQVKKLQKFLNDFMKERLSVTGVFNMATFNAVNRFQAKFTQNVLKPWSDAGLPTGGPTGYVYKTTRYWINKQLCGEKPIDFQLPKLP